MASSRRTYDTDVITLRTVFAKNVVNSNIPALRVLTADGTGATYWAIPSSLGGIPAFNEIITSAGTYTADLSYNRFRLLAGEGIGMTNGPAGSNQTTLYSKAFSEVDVSGNNSFYAFTSNTVTPIIRFAATGAIQVRSDPATNTLFIDGPKTAPYIVSTGVYGFSEIKVTPEASTITSSLQGWGGDYITANSPSTLLRFIGYNDIQLSTNVTTNSVFFTISTFNSADYLNISTTAYTAYSNAISTVSSLYTPLTLFSTSFNYLSSIGGASYSTLESTINGIAMSTGTEFYILTGLINARATIDQLNSEISSVNHNIQSTSIGLGTLGYISTGGGGVVGVDQLYSTVIGLGSAGYVSSGGGGSQVLDVDIASTLKYSPSFSTIALGYNAGYSNQDSNSIAIGYNTGFNTQQAYSLGIGFEAGYSNQGVAAVGIGFQAGYSNQTYNAVALGYSAGKTDQGQSAVAVGDSAGYENQGGLSVAVGINAGFTGQQIASVALGGNAGWTNQGQYGVGVGYQAGYLNQGRNSIGIGYRAGYSNQAPSSIVLNALGSTMNTTTAGFYVSPIQQIGALQTSLLSYDPSTSQIGQVGGIQVINNVLSTNTIYNTGGISTYSLEVFGPATLTNSGSTILRGAVYIEGQTYFAGNVITSENSGLVNTSTMNSTLMGLGSAGYVSTASLISTVEGISLNSASLVSTVEGLGSAGYISTASLTSTVAGISLNSASLRSTVEGLGSAGYISSASLTSTVNSLGTVGYISSPSLTSTVNSLGTVGYISSPSLVSTVTGLGSLGYLSTPSLTSTITGLGSVGYVSSPSLASTVAGIGVNASSLISSVIGLGSLGYLSTASLTSTINGLGSVGYVSSPSLASTVAGIGVNASSLISSVIGLGSLAYLSTPSLTSTINGLGSVGYVSSPSLASTVTGLGSVGYVSSLSNVPLISTQQILASSILGLNSLQGALVSTQQINLTPINTNFLIAVGSSGSSDKMTYSVNNGATWFLVTNNFSSQANAVAWNGRLWVAVGYNGGATGSIKYSYDGITWINSSSGGFSTGGNGVAWNGRQWVAVGNNGGTTGSIQYSYDGINWFNNSSGGFSTGSGGSGIAWNGSFWIAVGGAGVAVTIQYSLDGISWTNTSVTGALCAPRAVAWNGRIWVAVGAGSTTLNSIIYSTDGINWSGSASGGFSTQGNGVAWNGKQWVATGKGASTAASIQYSSNGINWSNSSSGGFTGTNGGYGILWNGSRWFACGDGGASVGVQYSFDGVNWTNVSGVMPFNAIYGIGYSVNITPSYNQTNFEIESQTIPNYFTSTNQLSFTQSSIIVNNTLFVDTTNKVGINTGNPTVDLDVNGIIRTAGISTIYFQTSSFVTAIISSLSFQTSSFVTPIVSTLRTQTSSLTFGNGIGWVTAGAFQAVAISSVQMNTALGYVSSLYVGSTSAVTLPFYTARINGDALISSLLVGAPVNTGFSSIGFRLAITHDSAVKPGTTTWTTTSDMRVKENIVSANVDQCYSDIKSLALRRFTWQSTFFQEWDGEDRRVLGFVAQEVSSIMPKSVKVMPAYGYPDFQFINVDQLNMALFGAVKKTMYDKEVLESTVKGQTIEIETLRGTTTFILSTLKGLQNQ